MAQGEVERDGRAIGVTANVTSYAESPRYHLTERNMDLIPESLWQSLAGGAQ